MLALVSWSGCGGCRSDPDAEAQQETEEGKKKEDEEKRKQEEKKPDFSVDSILVQPSSVKNPAMHIKPGHWVQATQAITANHFDFVGRLEASVVNSKGEPFELNRTPYRLTSLRPAALPKGSQKFLEVTFFIPFPKYDEDETADPDQQVAGYGHGPGFGQSSSYDIRSELRGRRGGHPVQSGGRLFLAMAAHQYHFVVLARNPLEYQFLTQGLHCFVAPYQMPESSQQTMTHYRVQYPAVDSSPVPLPSHPLAWTSTAYVLWDDVPAEVLSPRQQRALVDWLHWGGQLIVSGPQSLDGLRGSFLDPYLPVDAGDPVAYSAEQIAALNHPWTRTGRDPLQATEPWSGIELELRDGAHEVPGTAGLVAERSVGRGRIVVSAFRLQERDFIRWKGFDEFFNACLLRRPARVYRQQGELEMLQLTWADRNLPADDPRLNSRLRYFSRDAGVRNFEHQRIEDFNSQQVVHRYTEPTSAGGVAAWNPISLTSDYAREALREAAGITVPESSFVVWTIGLYLIVLVPLNWLCFYGIGKVEWAWISAPIVAVFFSGLVIRFAQLDIGFVRSQNEVSVLELQGDYPRGHLTRYTALYTSLSTTYDAHFDDASGVGQPFPISTDYRLLSGQERSTVTLEHDGDVRLRGLRISSNTTGMIRSEQMFDLEGPIAMARSTTGTPLVANQSQFDLKSVAVIQRQKMFGGVRPAICWLGELRRGESKLLKFRTFDQQELKNELPVAEKDERHVRLNVDPLVELALDPKQLEAGEVRLVGRIDGKPLPGQTIEPAAAQVRAATVVVAHLAPPTLPDPQRDANTYSAPVNLEAPIGR